MFLLLQLIDNLCTDTSSAWIACLPTTFYLVVLGFNDDDPCQNQSFRQDLQNGDFLYFFGRATWHAES